MPSMLRSRHVFDVADKTVESSIRDIILIENKENISFIAKTYVIPIFCPSLLKNSITARITGNNIVIPSLDRKSVV